MDTELLRKLSVQYTANPPKRMGGGLDLSGATNQANTAQQTGQGAINSFDPTATGNANLSSLTGLLNSQGGQTNDYMNAYKNAVAANPSVTDLYNTANQKFNVPALQTNATTLNNAITQLPSQATEQARGFDVTQGQINNQVANKMMYLSPAASSAQNAANTAEQLASNYVNAGLTQNQMNLLPIQSEQQFLAQQQAAAQTGWNQNAANTLQALTAKMNAGVTLSGQEMDMAKQLAQSEEAYQQQLTVNQTQLANTIQQQKYMNVAPGNTLVNTVAQGIINPSQLAKSKGYASY